MSAQDDDTYAELAATLETLHVQVQLTRRRIGASYAEVAEALGMAQSTLHRVETGHNYDRSTAVRILRWLADPKVRRRRGRWG